MEDCSVVVWWDITAAAMLTNCIPHHVSVIFCVCVPMGLCACLLCVLCLFVNVFVYLLVCWLGRLDWFRVKLEASVSHAHQWCVPARRVLALFLGRGEREKRWERKNVNKENMGGGQKRENGVFTRKLWPVFVALCQLWIIVSKMIVAYMRDCKCYRQWLPLWICFKLSLKDHQCTLYRLTNWESGVLIFDHLSDFFVSAKRVE